MLQATCKGRLIFLQTCKYMLSVIVAPTATVITKNETNSDVDVANNELPSSRETANNELPSSHETVNNEQTTSQVGKCVKICEKMLFVLPQAKLLQKTYYSTIIVNLKTP